MKIWLDDMRPKPDFYDVRVTKADEAIEALKTKLVTHISLDHDLGEGEKTGYEVALFIEKGAWQGTLPRIHCAVHSSNPSGAKKMGWAIKNAERYWDDKDRKTND